MKKELTIKITGEAGQGMKTIGIALCRILKACGYFVFAHVDVMSRIRGGNNCFQIRVSEEPVSAPRQNSDIIICLDRDSVEIQKDTLSENGLLILDREKFQTDDQEDHFWNVPFYKLANEKGGSDIFINSVACGIVSGLMALPFSKVQDVLSSVFSGKSDEIVQKNVNAAQAGYDTGKEQYRKGAFELTKGKAEDTILISGNETAALSAIKAGCKFFCAYPMSPSTGIMVTMAHYAKDFHILVEQAEDEIAAVNMIIGASFAGARSMTATSGGGFALMQEGVSLAGVTETPIVIVDCQRPAPGTGLPTRTEQADLDFVISSGHGEFAKAVFSPGTAEQIFSVVFKAFDISEKYQIPVLILTDQHLADSYMTVSNPEKETLTNTRYVISKEDSQKINGYKRYELTENGISPRAVPSWIKDVVYADSDEHTEKGHITESADVRNRMVEKRFYKKMKQLDKDMIQPESFQVDNAEIILIGFGSTYGVIKEVCESFSDKKPAFIHLSQVWPFPREAMLNLLKKAKKTITVENNAGGQLAKLIRRETGYSVTDSILKYDGRPFTLEGLKQRIQDIL